MKTIVKKTMGLLPALIMALVMLPTVVFAKDVHTITVTTDGNGTVSGPANAEEGAMLVWINITPNAGYIFDSCTATGIEEGDFGTTYCLQYSGWPIVGICINNMPGNDISFIITFAKAVTVTYDANGGTTGFRWSDTMIKRKGQSESFENFDDLIAPPASKEYDGVKINGVRFGPADFLPLMKM